MFILLLSGRGWYRGIFTDYKNASFHEMQQVKHFFHAEWGGDCHARRHAEDPFINLDKIEAGKGADERAGDASLYGGNARASKDGDWSESYMVRLIDWHLKEQGNDGLADRGGILASSRTSLPGTSGESCALCQSKRSSGKRSHTEGDLLCIPIILGEKAYDTYLWAYILISMGQTGRNERDISLL